MICNLSFLRRYAFMRIVLFVILGVLVFSLVSCSTILDILLDSALDDHDSRDHSRHSRDDDSGRPDRLEKKDPVPSGRLSGFTKPYRSSDSGARSDEYREHNDSYREHHREHRYYGGDYDSFETNTGGGGFFYSSGYSTPYFANYHYSGQPYNSGTQPAPGIYIHTGNDVPGNHYAAQFQYYYQSVSNNLDARGVDARILLPVGSALDFENISFREKKQNSTDKISYYKFTYNIASWSVDKNADTEIGVGFSSLVDVDTLDYNSFCLKASLDYFPRKPWGLHLKGSFAAPEYRTLLDLDARAGIYTGPLEIFIGYHTLINSLGESLNGPIFGGGLWF